MLRKLGIAVLICAGLGLGAFWFVSAPDPLSAGDLPDHTTDLDRGRMMFLIGGCASCHAAKDAEGDARLVLLGGRRFPTEFGTFVAPNISPDAENGIGAWTDLDFVNAMLRGLSPAGEHYYPAFPYASYARMTTEDVLDLWAYLQTLPTDARSNEDHEIGFPFSVRRTLGVWKTLYVNPDDVVGGDVDPVGRYLVEGPGHCGECHTPRDALGGLDLANWMGGAPNPEGRGRIPNITPGGKDTSSWSAADIAEYLKSGFTPDYDTAGGSMVDVIANTSELDDEMRMAIARYLTQVPALDGK